MSRLSELMEAAESADDDYRAASGRYATAKANYDERRWTLRVQCDDKRDWAREEFAQSQLHDQRRTLTITDDAMRSAKVHVDTVCSLLVAAQSQAKMERRIDGGER